MIRAGVLGATGYAGIEVVRLLSMHPEVKITKVISQSFEGQKIASVYPNLENIIDLECESLDAEKIASECDVVFTALPHGVSNEVIPALFEKGIKIIDLSGDYRYDIKETYEK